MKQLIVIFFCLMFGISHGQQSIIDSLQQRIDTHKKQDTLLVNLYTQLGNELIENKISKKALEYGEKAKELSEKLNYERGLLNSINVLAKYYQDDKNYSKSKAYFEEYIELSEKRSLKKGLMTGNNNLGLLYFDMGDYPKSLNYLFKALVLAEKAQDVHLMPIYYSNVARVYHANSQYEKAIDYTEKALKIEEENAASPRSIIIRSVNLSAYYTDFGYPEKTVNLLKRMLAFNDSTLQHPLYSAYMFANLGDAYIKLKDFKRSVEMILLAYPAFEGSDRMRAQLDLNLANSYSNLGQSKLASDYLKGALVIVEESKEPEFERFAYETASEVYKNENNFKKALEYYERASVIKDRLLNAEQSDEIVAMQTLFETRQKEDSIAIQQSQLKNERIAKDKVQAISDKKESFLQISIIALIIVSISSAIAIRLYRRSQKQKEKIESKNEENELLLGEIHHRVKNNLQVISSLLSLQERSMTDEKAKAAIIDGRERVQSIGLIHKHLYQSNNFSGIEMQSYVSNLVDGLINTMGDKSKPIRIELDVKKCELDIDTAVPLGLIINELAVNAIKHAFDGVESPELRISNEQIEDKTIWKISDNGIGKKIDIEGSKSFGMKLIRSLTRQLGGEYQVIEEDGLIFSLTLKSNKK